jgi:hypothetical protein
MFDLYCVHAFEAVRQSDRADLHTFDVDLWGTNPLGSRGGFSPQIDNEVRALAREHGGRLLEETSGNGCRTLRIRFDERDGLARARIRMIVDLADWGLDYGVGLDFDDRHHRDAVPDAQNGNPYEYARANA